jgi:hypothetical protein
VTVGKLNDQFVFDLVQIHLNVVTTHFLLPLVLKVEVLVLAELSSSLLLRLSTSSW